MNFAETIILLVVSIVLALLCYWFSERKPKTEKQTKTIPSAPSTPIEELKENREFQLRMFEIERTSTFVNSFLLVIIAISVSWYAVLTTLYLSNTIEQKAWIPNDVYLTLAAFGFSVIALIVFFIYTNIRIDNLRKEFVENKESKSFIQKLRERIHKKA